MIGPELAQVLSLIGNAVGLILTIFILLIALGKVAGGFIGFKL